MRTPGRYRTLLVFGLYIPLVQLVWFVLVLAGVLSEGSGFLFPMSRFFFSILPGLLLLIPYFLLNVSEERHGNAKDLRRHGRRLALVLVALYFLLTLLDTVRGVITLIQAGGFSGISAGIVLCGNLFICGFFIHFWVALKGADPDYL